MGGNCHDSIFGLPPPHLATPSLSLACGLTLLLPQASIENIVIAPCQCTVKYELSNIAVFNTNRCKRISQDHFSIRKVLHF